VLEDHLWDEQGQLPRRTRVVKALKMWREEPEAMHREGYDSSRSSSSTHQSRRLGHAGKLEHLGVQRRVIRWALSAAGGSSSFVQAPVVGVWTYGGLVSVK